MLDMDHLVKNHLALWDKTYRETPGYIQTLKPQRHHTSICYNWPLCFMTLSFGLFFHSILRFFAQEISWLLSTCYPETIQRVFVGFDPLYYPLKWFTDSDRRRIALLVDSKARSRRSENIATLDSDE
ncbi:hypothetical protein N7457_000621 [Penicillium paradoxum]|uniref:uncharacterized protein n=1 Tax=Penicillium paradoxum TaxID=176176 RepID=UPI00254721BE|nr:uncharacterized protein N7457_000621 [Penicillium paradoxum]KAJ5794022.1 hypothetical protein N7457_000621 [Penicillium paradoxum]